MPQIGWDSFHLNIRQKMVVGMVVSMLAFSLLGKMSYDYLIQIESRLRLAEVVDDLSNIILEIRRYEKNYLLYHQEADYEESLDYSRQALDLAARLRPDLGAGAGAEDLSELKEQVDDFREAFSRLVEALGRGQPADQEKNLLRDRGKAMVELSQKITAAQRERILGIVSTLKHQLLYSIFVLLGTGLLFAWFVGRKMVRALRFIEQSTVEIAQGNFRPVPVFHTGDETQSVAEAFNRMIVELDTRQDQLLQEKKLASLGVLTSGIAHQLNNPLNNISTSCQILMEEGQDCDPAFARQLLANVDQEVKRSRDIVKGLLEFSRSTRFTLAPTVLAEVVDKAVGLVASQRPAGVEIVREVPRDLILPLDAQHFQEVLLNLLINAIQAIQATGVEAGRITVAGRAEPEPGQAVLTVEDTGVGIKAEHLGKVFDPFFTLKEVGHGTGLGLSVVFGIVRKHGGTVTVESREGQGARFVIRLPLSRAEGGAA